MRLLVLLILLNPMCTSARELVFGYIDFPPLFYFDKQQQVPKGRVVDLLQQIEAITEHRFKMVRYPVGRLYQAIEQGRVDTYTTVRIAEMAVLGHISQNSFTEIDIALLSSDPIGMVGVNTLRGTIAAMRGYLYNGQLQELLLHNPSLQITLRNSHLSLIKSLQKKRIHYAIDYLAPAQAAARDIGFSDMRHKVIDKAGVHFYVTKSLNGSVGLGEEIDLLLPGLQL